MAVREFTDREGVRWHAWTVTPDQLYPQTKAEDYLTEYFQLGWMVFERRDGQAKRRLCPYPKDWATRSDAALERLLQDAEVVFLPTADAGQGSTVGADDPPSLPLPPALADAATENDGAILVRSFRYPGGRMWTACLIPSPESSGKQVLRFQAGMRTIDAPQWPRDWAALTDTDLVEVLRLAAPRPDAPAASGAPHRRYGDARA